MKLFIVFSVLALLFIIGSALAVKAIGRNVPEKKSEDVRQNRENEQD